MINIFSFSLKWVISCVTLFKFNNNLFTQNNTQTFDSLQGALLRVSVQGVVEKKIIICGRKEINKVLLVAKKDRQLWVAEQVGQPT